MAKRNITHGNVLGLNGTYADPKYSSWVGDRGQDVSRSADSFPGAPHGTPCLHHSSAYLKVLIKPTGCSIGFAPLTRLSGQVQRGRRGHPLAQASHSCWASARWKPWPCLGTPSIVSCPISIQLGKSCPLLKGNRSGSWLAVRNTPSLSLETNVKLLSLALGPWYYFAISNRPLEKQVILGAGQD